MTGGSSFAHVLDDVPDRGEQAHGSNIVTRNSLTLILVGGDLAALLIGYSASLLTSGYLERNTLRSASAVLLAVLLGGFWALRSQGLFLSRVSAVPVLEVTRATRALSMLAATLLLTDRVFELDLRISEVVVASVLSLFAFMISRSTYRAWLSVVRSSGRHCRSVLILGTDAEAARLTTLIETHPEMGIRAVGVIGHERVAEIHGLTGLWIGEDRQAEMLISKAGVSAVIVSSTGLPTERLNALIRNLRGTKVHVFVSTGFSGIEARRIRSTSIAHEPMLQVEVPTVTRTQASMKRLCDVTGGVLALVILSPVFAIVAAAIKMNDRGPIFFRQERVGREGRHFDLLKFRTMVVDAEQQLELLVDGNERRGPLFKMKNDPRVTRIGRFLRESSLDELPQLLNVIKGDMSLVGPRPALPSEVRNFSSEVRARELVPPGITGLWQVEARDNPSFEAYCRLDLFYVENWSLTLDLFIVVGTIEQLVARLLRSIFRTRRNASPESETAGVAANVGRLTVRRPVVAEVPALAQDAAQQGAAS